MGRRGSGVLPSRAGVVDPSGCSVAVLDSSSGTMRTRRPRITWLVAALLLLETAGVGATEFTILDRLSPNFDGVLASVGAFFDTAVTLGLLPSGAVALAATIAVLVSPRRTWLAAMLAQVVTLGACLGLYAKLGSERPFAIALLMAYAVLLVPYLNSGVVRTAMLPVHRDD
jgi:hypothetical protein